MNNTTLILDSSVIAKWFFPENDSEKALAIKENFTNNTVTIVIPILLYYEINNLLRTAVKTYRVAAKDAINAYNAFLKLNLTSYSSELLLEKTLEIALQYSISSYDASYISLANYLQVPFLTADKRLLNKIKNKFVIDLQEYTV